MKQVCVLLAIAACHGNDATPDALHDAADPHLDAALDASPELAPLVGMWKIAPEQFDQTPTFTEYAFHADGTFDAIEHNGSVKPGIYSVPSPGRLKFEDPDHSDPLETDFLIVGERLAYNAWLPEGTITDFVGTWKSDAVTDTGSIDLTLVLANDHSATTTIGTGSPLTGTWATESTGVAFTSQFLSYHPRVVGAVMSETVWVKE
jgi:hypothetical protein